ncbi:hypothetical protein J7I94_26935 [Streptomyces sp. ISL-12]|uniref:phthiocerol/phthiodiolone dimycocerosyl transferase family protein n=1 Tax=Streptomyces sp. ISL-12 TaxID=2819177 RepID=UPI001BE882F7|nr:hypothetical protein [Streptomyces sp. ISL-12]MBT2414138.1 hypothetical protein [Streptomyces sp. ISL-12]
MSITPRAVYERPLAGHEAMFVQSGTPVVLCHSLGGPVDREVLDESLRVLAGVHPVLTARCRPGPDGPLLRCHPAAPPRLRTGTDFAAATAPFAPGAPMVRATLLEQPGGDRLFVLCVHHAIADGVSALTALAQLWEICTARITGRAPRLPPATDGLPHPVEPYFRHRVTRRQIDGFLARRAARARALSPLCLPAEAAGTGGPARGVHVRRVALDREQTARLVRTARDSGISTHSVACGLVLTAVRDVADDAPGVRTLTCASALDVRRRLVPPLPAHRVVMAVAALETHVPVASADDPVRVGRLVRERMRATVRSGELDLSIAALPELAAQALARGPALPLSVAVSDLTARAPALPMPPELSASAPWGYVEVHGPVPVAALTGHHSDALGLTLALPRAFFTAGQAQRLAGALHRTTRRALGAP